MPINWIDRLDYSNIVVRVSALVPTSGYLGTLCVFDTAPLSQSKGKDFPLPHRMTFLYLIEAGGAQNSNQLCIWKEHPFRNCYLNWSKILGL